MQRLDQAAAGSLLMWLLFCVALFVPWATLLAVKDAPAWAQAIIALLMLVVAVVQVWLGRKNTQAEIEARLADEVEKKVEDVLNRLRKSDDPCREDLEDAGARLLSGTSLEDWQQYALGRLRRDGDMDRTTLIKLGDYENRSRQLDAELEELRMNNLIRPRILDDRQDVLFSITARGLRVRTQFQKAQDGASPE